MRWYSYLVGYLIVIIECQFPEKVINMAMTRGIFLWDIMHIGERKIILKVRLHAFKPLARITRKCGGRIQIKGREGLPFQIKHIKRRKTLALGGILFLLSLYILSSFVWVVEVSGNEDLTAAKIKEIAARHGLKAGAVIKRIDLDKIEEEMLDSHPKLAWVGISIQGTKVTIEISEKVLIPETDETKIAHIVAKEAGVIKEMLVLIGTPLVKEGDKVHQGQILISGMVYPEIFLNDDGTYGHGGNPDLVRAKGVVRANVSHITQGDCPVEERKRITTGLESRQVILKVGRKQFVVQGPQAVPFQYYQLETHVEPFHWRNIKLPVELVTNIYLEEKQIINKYGLEGAYQEAVKRAEDNLTLKLPEDIKILNKSVELISPQDNKIVTVEVTWECLEDIAVPLLISTDNIGDS
ncbi:MAG: sporulation protein YqfD [Peptococcaceae bacterium]